VRARHSLLSHHRPSAADAFSWLLHRPSVSAVPELAITLYYRAAANSHASCGLVHRVYTQRFALSVLHGHLSGVLSSPKLLALQLSTLARSQYRIPSSDTLQPADGHTTTAFTTTFV
jgi:hypothetical protein